MNYKETYESWLASDRIDDATKAELLSIKDNEDEIRSSRYSGLCQPDPERGRGKERRGHRQRLP